MRISIVTISYNQGIFLEQALLSVINQTYDDIEYIVVDPGSTDNSRDILYKYRKSLSRVILDSDLGPADGLNSGFKFATGEIYGFLNSDDVLDEFSISSVANFFKNNPHIDVISGHSWIIDSEGNKLRKFYSDYFSIELAIRGASLLSQPSTFFRASAFASVGGFNKLNNIAWDGELFLDMALKGASFAVTNQIFSSFRVHADGLTGSGKLELAYKDYYRYIFKKVKKRNMSLIDIWSLPFARFIRKILNPKDTFERLCSGPIFKRDL